MTKWPLGLLRWFVGEGESEVLEGDLLELFAARETERGKRQAIVWLWWDVMDVSIRFFTKRESRR